MTPFHSNISPLFALAVSEHQHGNYSTAEDAYLSVLRLDQNQPDANHNYGILLLQTGRAAESMPFFARALKLNPSNGQYWISYGEAILLAGDCHNALELIEEGRRHGLAGANVDDLEVRVRNAVETELVNQLSTRESHSPEDMGVLERLFREGRYDLLGKIAQGLTLRFPLLPLGWKIQGAVMRKLGDVFGALSVMRKALSLAPHDPEIHYNLGIIADELGHFVEGEAYYRSALRLLPGMLLAMNNLGVNLHKQRRYEEAEQCFLACLQVSPHDIQALNNRAAALMELSRFGEAESACKTALSLEGDHGDILTNLGNLYHRQGRIEQASESYQQALHLQPQNAGAYNNLGNLHVDAGRLLEAEHCFRRALECQPTLGDAWNNLANLLTYTGSQEQEVRAYERAREVSPFDSGLVANVFMAVRFYISGQYERAKSCLADASNIASKTEPKFGAAKAYWGYLNSLLFNQASISSISTCDHDIYVFGDSHSLGFHGLELSIAGTRYGLKTEWIPGIKQWHLASQATNKYKHRLGEALKLLPKDANLLFVIGEIDCRRNEGIWRVLSKSPERRIEEVVLATVTGYLDHLLETAGKRHRNVVMIPV